MKPSITAILRSLALTLLALTGTHSLTQAAAPATAQAGKQVVQACASRLRSAPSLDVAFTTRAGGHRTQGMLTMQGAMFTISTPGMMSWYDGTTQWTYSSQIGEVNVINPTPDELGQINPLAILDTFTQAYTPGTPSTSGGKTSVQLNARNPKADIRSALLTVDAAHWPSSVTLVLADGSTVDITVDRITQGRQLPAKAFKYDPSRLPGIEVVDLR